MIVYTFSFLLIKSEFIRLLVHIEINEKDLVCNSFIINENYARFTINKGKVIKIVDEFKNEYILSFIHSQKLELGKNFNFSVDVYKTINYTISHNLHNKNGLYKEYYDSGCLYIKQNIINNKKNGIYKQYDINGILVVFLLYKDNIKIKDILKDSINEINLIYDEANISLTELKLNECTIYEDYKNKVCDYIKRCLNILNKIPKYNYIKNYIKNIKLEIVILMFKSLDFNIGFEFLNKNINFKNSVFLKIKEFINDFDIYFLDSYNKFKEYSLDLKKRIEEHS